MLSLERPPKTKKKESWQITFTMDDAQGIQHPHDDALMGTMTVANYTT